MVACDIVCALIIWIQVRIPHVCDVYKDSNLVDMLVHGLDFILYLKRIAFSIVNKYIGMGFTKPHIECQLSHKPQSRDTIISAR
jgi:hypothetical protein